MKKLLIVVIFFQSIIFSQCFAQGKFIAANNQNIRYVGRFDFSKNNEASFDWSGVYIQFRFKGTSCSIKMSDTKHNYYQVLVDSLPAKTFDVKSDTTLLIANNLSDKTHKVQIFKRTEGSEGIATFKGILLSNNGEMLPWEGAPTRKIEFIGNSITCGYGTEGLSKSERWKPSTENNYLSYAAIVSRAFNADYHVIAHSGKGVVRNYGDKQKVSPYPMPERFDRVYDEKELPSWDFKRWQPDAVVINLGTNDFSTQPFPDENVFKKGYENLIGKVQKHYGNLPVFCLVGPLIDEPCHSYVKQVVDEFKNKNVYFIAIPPYLLNQEKDLGSDMHPNYNGQLKMATFILPVLSTVLNWEYKIEKPVWPANNN